MKNRKAVDRNTVLWKFAALAAPVAHTASACSWLAVLLAGGGILLVCWWAERYLEEKGKWTSRLQNLWTSILVCEMLHWSAGYWPGHENPHGAPLILLALAAWLATGGRARVSNVACALCWPVLCFIMAVVLPAVSDVKVERLIPMWNMKKADLLSVLLIVFLSNRGAANKKLYGGILGMGVLVAAITTGVLSANVSSSLEAPFYELSRSLTLFGVVERFESITAAVMTIGLFVTVSYLLSGERKTQKESLVCAGFSGVLYSVGIRVDSRINVIGIVVLWIVFPLLESLKKYFQKTPKTS